MLRSNYRSAYVIVVSGVAGLLALSTPTIAREARAEAPPDSDVKASMQCDRVSEPGRVRCTVEARIEGGRTLAWADVELLSLPEFASALKGRIGPKDALAHDAISTKWALGLVARRAGQGEARARVRLVVCDVAPAGAAAPDAGAPPPRCVPLTVIVKTQLTVGG